MKNHRGRRSAGLVAASLALGLVASAWLRAGSGKSVGSGTQGDWPQWRGPDRTDLSREAGLLREWPPSGPPRVWSASAIGAGYGSVAIRGNRVLVQGRRDNGVSAVFCLDRADGHTLWVRDLGQGLDHDRGAGPRSTPTIDEDQAYVLTENGDLARLRLDDGSVVWQKNILADFGGKNPHWLVSESPLVDGSRLVVTPGGPGAGIVALDKTTGATLWKSAELSDPAGYSSCVAADVGGVRTIVGLTAANGVGVRASDGKLMWSYPRVANRTANVATPIVHGDKVFYSSAYGTGCALLGLKPDGGLVRAEEIYFSREMMNHHGGVVLVGDYLYGFSNSILVCMEFASGNVRWKDRSVGKGSVTVADGHLYLFGERNIVGLAEATPEGYREKGRFEIADVGLPSWAHPVVCGGRLYIRNQGTLTCYDVRAR